MNENQLISIVIPIYNEEENIPLLCKRITSSAIEWEINYEVIFVDDGSSDNSLLIIKGLIDNDSHLKAVKLSRNFGHQAAISAGLKVANGDAVIIMDGDLQDPPEELISFIKKWKEGYEVVYAIRTKRKEGFIKKQFYNLFYRLFSILSNIEVPLDSGDFCIMDRKIVNVINNDITESTRFIRGLRSYSGYKQIGIEYERNSRAAGKPKYTIKKLIQLALDGLLDFSVIPLRMATFFGILVSVISFFAGTLFALHKIFEFDIFGYSPSETPGIITLAVIIYFLFGLLLLILGIIGEYIGKIYIEVKKRPYFIIDKIIKNENKI